MIAPLPGPINEAPWSAADNDAEAKDMLAAAVDGLDLGAYDKRILDWVGKWDVPTIATLASIIHRARQAPRVNEP